MVHKLWVVAYVLYIYILLFLNIHWCVSNIQYICPHCEERYTLYMYTYQHLYLNCPQYNIICLGQIGIQIKAKWVKKYKVHKLWVMAYVLYVIIHTLLFFNHTLSLPHMLIIQLTVSSQHFCVNHPQFQIHYVSQKRYIIYNPYQFKVNT